MPKKKTAIMREKGSFVHESAKLGNNVTLSYDTVLEKDVIIGNDVTFYPKVRVKAGCTIFDGAVIGRPPKSAGNTTRKIDIHFRPVIIGENSIIGANAVLYTGIKIGKNVLIGDLASIREDCIFSDQVVIGRGVMVMYETKVGERTRVIDGTILTGNMLIESDVFIGPGVNSINDNRPYLARFGLESFHVGGATIRRFALIGAGANLNADIEIGRGAIVAPNAMVTRNVAPWTVVAGVPAKFLREVAPKERRLLLKHFKLGLSRPK